MSVASYRSPPHAAPSTVASVSSPQSPTSTASSSHSHQPAIHSDSPSHDDPDAEAEVEVDVDQQTDQDGHTTLDQSIETDSLADADPAEVAQRAQELLAMADDPVNHPITGNLATGTGGGSGGNGNGSGSGNTPGVEDFTTLHRLLPSDIPRTFPKGTIGLSSVRKNAELFLRKCVSEVDETDWQFSTPKVFRNPVGLDELRKEGRGFGGPTGLDGGGEGGLGDEDWRDEAFNLESYSSISYPQVGEEEMVEMEGGRGFGDGEEMDLSGPSTSSFAGATIGAGHYGTPYLRDSEEENAVGAGFGLGGMRRTSRNTGALVRGVEEMAMF